MLITREPVRPENLQSALARFFDGAAPKVQRLCEGWNTAQHVPAATVQGRYTAAPGVTWTRGLLYGAPLLVYDVSNDAAFFHLGRRPAVERMPAGVTQADGLDNGCNALATYGTLLRFMREGRTIESEGMRQLYELAIRSSASAYGARWTGIEDGTGFMYSAHGAHSLRAESIRACRVLLVAHQLGHRLDAQVPGPRSLLRRAYEHVCNIAQYNVYYGTDRDRYDVPGRVAEETHFDAAHGRFCGPSSRHGYSPYTTWTRGLATAMLGAAELLECVAALPATAFDDVSRVEFLDVLERMAQATCDFYIAHTPPDGIPYWDTGAPGLAHMPGHLDKPADPDNPLEPVDSSAAVLAAQALLRFAEHRRQEGADPDPYAAAGYTIARTLLSDRYLSADAAHEGLLLHSTYHRPSGWDYVPPDSDVPQGESSLWGDYHLLELAVYLHRRSAGAPYLAFFHRPTSA